MGRPGWEGDALKELYQGDIIKIKGLKSYFIIVSKNEFIKFTGCFHVCPIVNDCDPGPLHIAVKGQGGTIGTVICEQVKIIDPSVRACSKKDRVSYDFIMDIADAIQGIFEYD